MFRPILHRSALASRCLSQRRLGLSSLALTATAALTRVHAAAAAAAAHTPCAAAATTGSICTQNIHTTRMAATQETQAKAIRVHAVGGPDALQLDDITLPAPAPNQVLIELYEVGVNYIDTYHRGGLYKLPLPAIIGREGAGIIKSVGSGVSGLAVGDRAVFFSANSYATHALVEASSVVKIAEGLSFKNAVTAHLQGLTAHAFISSVYPVKKGDVVLIHAAAGGTGNIMVQMCKIRGATVIATVGSAEKVLLAKEAGADYVINYSESDFVTEVKRITNNVGVNVVYDGVGKSTFEGSLNSLRKRGMMVSFGNASGPVPPVELFTLTAHGSISLARPTVAHFVEDRAELESRIREIQDWVVSGQLKLRIAKEFPLEQAKEAHIALESRQFAGKILLNVKQE